MSNVEVKAGTCWRSHDCDDSWDRVRWNGDTLEYVFEDGTTESSGLEPAFFDDNPKTWKRVPDVSLRELSKALPALLAAARKVQNLLDEVARHRIDGMDVLASALWDDVMAVASELRTAITAYEQQVKP